MSAPRGAAPFLALLLIPACDGGGRAPGVVFDDASGEAWVTRSPVPPPARGDLALITNNFDDTVSLVDLGLSPPAEIGRYPVGRNPIEREGVHHLTLMPDGKTAWVGISNFVPASGSGPHGSHGTGTADGYGIEIALADGAEVGSVRVDRNPGDVRVTPDGRWVLMSHFDLLRVTEAGPGADPAELASRLAVIDPITKSRAAMIPTCPATHGIAIAPDSRTAWVACYDDHIAAVDLSALPDGEPAVTLVAALPIPGTIAAPSCLPYALTRSPDGDTVWVSCLQSGEVRALDTRTGAMDPARVVSLGGAAYFGAFSPPESGEGGLLIVPTQGPDRLRWIDPASATVVHTLDFAPAQCDRPHAVGFTRGRVLVVCEGDRASPGTLVVIDAATRAVASVVPVGRYPDDLAVRQGAP